MKTKGILLILICSAIIFAAVGFNKTAPKNTGAVKNEKRIAQRVDMTAKITKIEYDNDKMISIMVENLEKKEGSYDEAIMLISENTSIVEGDIPVTSLSVGQKVELTFQEGPITMIYPPRIGATFINIIE